MKTIHIRLSLVVTLLTLTTITVQARSWRINNNAMQSPNFASINAAMSSDEVVAGDTLYLDPGCGLSGNQTISKQVTVIGCGYMRADVPHDMASILEAIYIKADYSKIEGAILNGTVYIDANNVTLERCKTNEIHIGVNKATAQHATIRQCYATRVRGNGKTDLRSAYCTIENCIIKHNDTYGVLYMLYFPSIKNCYLREACTSTNLNGIFYDSSHHTVINSILLNVGQSKKIWNNTSDEELVQNNFLSSNDVTEDAIFKLEGTGDQCYQLADDSPARGAAADGGDCGPMGGDYPYVVGGLPAGFPYYQKALISPRSENDKVKVSLQIKMQNE